MTSNRSNSPDKYIGITKNVKNRCLTREEKLMLLNVYGVLRKEVRLSVTAAATRAADLCGVGSSAIYNAKKEFDNREIATNRSVDLPVEESAQYTSENQIIVSSNSELQPCNHEVHFMVKEKILEMLGDNGTTTIKSVVEAFEKDPLRPNLEETTIRNIIKQLNLTSYLSQLTPEQIAMVQQSSQHECDKNIGSEENGSDVTLSAISSASSHFPTNADTSPVQHGKKIADQNMEVDDECHIVYCQTHDRTLDGMADTIKYHAVTIDEDSSAKSGEAIILSLTSPPEVILPDSEEQNETNTNDPFEFHDYLLPKVKTEATINDGHDSDDKGEVSMIVVKSEVESGCSGPDPKMAGIFPNRPTPSELAESTEQGCTSDDGNPGTCNLFLQVTPTELPMGMGGNNSNPNVFIPITQPESSAGKVKHDNSNSGGIFSNVSELSVRTAENAFRSVNSYTLATATQPATTSTSLNEHSLPLTGILVYGINIPSTSNSFSLRSSANSPKSVHYISSIPMEENSNSIGIFPNTPPEPIEEPNENFTNSFTFCLAAQPTTDSPTCLLASNDPLSVGVEVYKPSEPISSVVTNEDGSLSLRDIPRNTNEDSQTPIAMLCRKTNRFKVDCPCCKGEKAIVQTNDGHHEYTTPYKLVEPQEHGENRPHSSGRHKRDKYYSCNFCQKIFSRQGHLCVHLTAAHKLPHTTLPRRFRSISDARSWRCKYCLQVLSNSNKKALIRHVMFLHTMKSLKCDFCDSSFSSALRLVRHTVNLHAESFLEQQGIFLAL